LIGFGFSPNEIDRIYLLFNITRKSEQYKKANTSDFGNSVKDYFAILGISRDTSIEELKKAYRSLAMQHHPDILRSKGIPIEDVRKAEELLKLFNEAYEWLLKKHYMKD